MKLVINWSLCDGNGVCTIEAPDLLELDDDDNLVFKTERFEAGQLPQAEAAVRVCPKQALRIDYEQ